VKYQEEQCRGARAANLKIQEFAKEKEDRDP
jgi:hypothetical protein